MSGGSLNYIYHQIEDVANYVPDPEIRQLTKDFSSLLKSLEWYLSGDTCEGEWLLDVSEFRGKWLRGQNDENLKTIFYEKLESTKNDFEEAMGIAKHCEDCKNFTKEDNSRYGQCCLHSGCLDHYYSPKCQNFIEQE